MSRRSNSRKKELNKLNLEELDIKLKLLEVQFAQQKNADLQKRWYHDPQWMVALSPLICSIFTLIVTWYTGALQTQTIANNIDKQVIDNDKKAIVIERGSMQLSKKKLKKWSDSLIETNSKLELNISDLLSHLAPVYPKFDSELQDYLKSKPEFKQKLATEFPCDQRCGQGHFSMRVRLIVEDEAAWRAWCRKQNPLMANLPEIAERIPEKLKEKAQKYLPALKLRNSIM